ncbi:MAG: HAD-IIB family hydrolase [Candidatus Micrarchaeota archaeon]|nr:HAD-IIB family hydrolase [Candidatus Micrarchaeota archaeon]
MDYRAKKIVIADLDGTLAPSKSRMDSEMSSLIVELLEYKDFAVISGGRFEQFQKQFVSGLENRPERFSRLYLLPTCATAFYKFEEGEWQKVYSEDLSSEQKVRIMQAFETALRQAGYQKPEKVYGQILEDRGTQITFSANGQEAPLELKTAWDPDQKKRLLIKSYLDKLLPEFEIRVGGTNSIDVTKKGIDKAYGIRKIESYFGYKIGEMLFLGDALFDGGNDYPVKQVGVDSIQVSGPEDTKKILRDIIAVSKKVA